VLDRLGIRLLSPEGQGCCGAVSHHLSADEEALAFMRRNIDAWWPAIEAGAEAILVSASGCGVMVKEYGELLKEDPAYAQRARIISERAKDPVEVLAGEPLEALALVPPSEAIAFHSPCTLQHGQKLDGVVETLLRRLGFRLTPVADAHLCCGSAGTYSILQPELSQRLLENKLISLQAPSPALIATANVGCQLHLERGAEVPVKHWLELLADALPD
jgi:glycolate oxidase iron-sulfur subunit